MDRHTFLKRLGILGASAGMPAALSSLMPSVSNGNLFFEISLAEWSLHRALQGGDITHLEFPEVARKQFGIGAVEYVNQFFADKARNKAYLDELNNRCADLGVEQLIIMVDGEGELAVSNEKERKQAVENHHKWVEAAEYLGCHSIRVNTFGTGSRTSQKASAVDSLGELSEFAQDYGINILVENHGGYSSDGEWLTDVIRQVDMSNCGTLPDFGNFCIRRKDGARWGSECVKEYNAYRGVEEMMPFARGVSAKSYAFDDAGAETTIDYRRMLKIIRDAGYSGHIGIEYEGSELDEYDGIRATKKLLEQAGAALAD
ncbi:MAG: sugar phosphate isomerase/epimerase family protein [Fodinibius sp.]|nr:sugar phosphate isomerase/epimerase family protein [Fodinibius sp.]